MGRFLFVSVGLDICELSHSDAEQNNEAEIALMRWSWLDSFQTLQRFVCSENTTDRATRANSLDMRCLPTGGKRLLVRMDNIVLYLYVLLPALFNKASISPLFHSFIHSFTHYFMNFTVFAWGVQHRGDVFICPGVSIPRYTKLSCSSFVVAVVVVLTLSHTAKRNQHAWGSDIRG